MEFSPNNINQGTSDADEISLKEVFIRTSEWIKYLISKWLIILLFGILGGLIGLTISLIDKPTYKATLTFAMEEDKGAGSSGLSGALGLASSFGIDLGGAGGGGVFASSNLGELMKSRLIIEKVLFNPISVNNKTLTLLEYYIETNKLRNSWVNIPDLKNYQFSINSDRSKFTRNQDSVIMSIHQDLINDKNLKISQKDKKVTILTIEVISNNELFSKLFCENLAKETSEFYIETKSKKAKNNVDVLQKQVDSIRYQLNNAILGVAVEVDNMYNLNPARNIKVANSKKKQIDVQSNTTLFTNLLVQLELAKITLRKETPLIQLIDMPIMPLEKQKIGKLKSLIFGGLIASAFAILLLIFKRVVSNFIN